jgi:hypothetical protein
MSEYTEYKAKHTHSDGSQNMQNLGLRKTSVILLLQFHFI